MRAVALSCVLTTRRPIEAFVSAAGRDQELVPSAFMCLGRRAPKDTCSFVRVRDPMRPETVRRVVASAHDEVCCDSSMDWSYKHSNGRPSQQEARACRSVIEWKCLTSGGMALDLAVGGQQSALPVRGVRALGVF
jgi:hypothetical protein